MRKDKSLSFPISSLDIYTCPKNPSANQRHSMLSNVPSRPDFTLVEDSLLVRVRRTTCGIRSLHGPCSIAKSQSGSSARQPLRPQLSGTEAARQPNPTPKVPPFQHATAMAPDTLQSILQTAVSSRGYGVVWAVLEAMSKAHCVHLENTGHGCFAKILYPTHSKSSYASPRSPRKAVSSASSLSRTMATSCETHSASPSASTSAQISRSALLRMRNRLPPGLDNFSPDGSLRCVKLFDMTLGDDNVLEDPATNDSGCKLDVAKRGFSVQVKNTLIEVLDEDEDVASVGAVSAPECHLRTSLLIAEDDSSICGETSDKTYAEVTEATGIATFQRVDAGSQTLPLEQTETGMQTQSMPKPRRGRVNGRATQTDSDNRPSDFELPTVTNPCRTEVAVLRKDDIVKIEVPFLSHDREVVIDSAAPSWGQNMQKMNQNIQNMMICMMGKIDGTADDILEVKTLGKQRQERGGALINFPSLSGQLRDTMCWVQTNNFQKISRFGKGVVT